MQKIFTLVSISLLFLPVRTVVAQSSEQIRDFSVEIELAAEGVAEVTESITYDFGNNERRGIFRNIPFVYAVDGDNGLVGELSINSVTRDGRTEPFIIDSISNGIQNIRIGNAEVFITGSHVYEIQYELSPVVVMADDGFDIFRFDAPGTGWDVPVDSASITISSETTPTEIICYQGALGSTEQDCNISGATVASTGGLQPGETITLEAVFPDGSFTNYASVEDISAYRGTEDGTFAAIVVSMIMSVLVIGPMIYLGAGHWAYKRRRKEEVVYARYEAPKDMSPAEIGLLVDNSSSGAEISAAIISMATKGYLTIELTQKKSFFRKAKLSFTSTAKPIADLPEGESRIYTALFNAQTNKTVKSTDFEKSRSFAKKIEKFHSGLKTSLKEKGFYRPVNIFRWSLAQRMTDEGYTKWAEVEGFRDFLRVTEKDRLAFHDAPKRTPEQFSEFLPYAVALGVEEQWAKQFEGLNVDISSWYGGQGTNLASSYALASSIGSLSTGLNGFSSAASSSGSSGSGGGFSGGGSGGGGGGSW